MRRFRLIPDKTAVPFMRLRIGFFALSILLAIGSVAVLGARGLNFGIDFAGGILIEVGTERPADIGAMRGILGDLNLGEVALQEFGSANDVLIRIERQLGDADAQQAAVTTVRTVLSEAYPGDLSYRRVEFVGPKVGAELIQAGIIAVVVSVVLMLAYIWFRFERAFAIGAVVALVHDVVLTLGMFAALDLEFNLAIVAAILLIVGYSMNDTVVVYDRVRENLRKYKTMPLLDLLNLSVNETLARTTITSLTTLLALLALFIFGGEVIRGFTFAMIWGVIVGTYSSIFVAGAILMYVQPQRGPRAAKAGVGTAERLDEIVQAADAAALSAGDGGEPDAAQLTADEGDDAELSEEERGQMSRKRRRASSSRERRKRRRGSPRRRR